MKFVRQITRGCGKLPHVGEHPGTALAIGLVAMGALAGNKGGWIGALGGMAFMALFILPIYLYGAYDRANLSDELETQDQRALNK